MKEGESLEQFAKRLERTMKIVNPDVDSETQSRMACDRFIEGVKNMTIKRKLLEKGPFAGIQEALSAAEATKAIESYTRGNLEEKIDQLTKQLEEQKISSEVRESYFQDGQENGFTDESYENRNYENYDDEWNDYDGPQDDNQQNWHQEPQNLFGEDSSDPSQQFHHEWSQDTPVHHVNWVIQGVQDDP